MRWWFNKQNSIEVVADILDVALVYSLSHTATNSAITSYRIHICGTFLKILEQQKGIDFKVFIRYLFANAVEKLFFFITIII